MSSADSALRRLGPHSPPAGAAAAAPQVGRAAPPARAPCAQGPWRILQHHSGVPSRNHRPWQSLRLPLKGPTPGPCHGILSRGPLPYFPSLNLRLRERVSALEAPRRQCHRGASLFLGPELGTHPSTVPGWARGGGDASAEGEYPNSWYMGSSAQS